MRLLTPRETVCTDPQRSPRVVLDDAAFSICTTDIPSAWSYFSGTGSSKLGPVINNQEEATAVARWIRMELVRHIELLLRRRTAPRTLEG